MPVIHINSVVAEWSTRWRMSWLIAALCLTICALVGCRRNASEAPPSSATSKAASNKEGQPLQLAAQEALKQLATSRPQEAERLIRDAMARVPASELNALAFENAVCRRILAQALLDQGRYGEAAAVAVDSYTVLLELFPPDREPFGHEELARAARLLALIRMREGRPAEAEPLLREALTWFEGRRIGEVDTVMLIGEFGECLHQQGRFEEAEDAVTVCYLSIRRMRGDEATETQEALLRVLAFYESWNKPEKVAEYQAMASEPLVP